MEKSLLLARLKKAIVERMGADRFRGVLLFGSEARSTATENSDIDVLVLLTGPVHFGSDLQEVITATYSIQLEIDRGIHFFVADIKDYESADFSLYRTIKSEGIPA